jgi:ribosome-associated protein
VDPQIVSKTKKKREMHELQSLGVALARLSDAQLETIEIPADLREALLEARRIKSREAKRRQMQYIGRLMRELDAAPIRAQLAALEGNSAQANARHRRLEAWRERLLGDDGALTAFAAEYPGADLQVLRTLIRNARREASLGRAPRAYRELFRVVKEIASSTSVQG